MLARLESSDTQCWNLLFEMFKYGVRRTYLIHSPVLNVDPVDVIGLNKGSSQMVPHGSFVFKCLDPCWCDPTAWLSPISESPSSE